MVDLSRDDLDDSKLYRQFPLPCALCHNFISIRNLECRAYPNGIPDEILKGEVDHRSPYKGDDGITFEAIPGLQYQDRGGR